MSTCPPLLTPTELKVREEWQNVRKSRCVKLVTSNPRRLKVRVALTEPWVRARDLWPLSMGLGSVQSCIDSSAWSCIGDGAVGPSPTRGSQGVQVWTVVADPGLKMMNPNQSSQCGPGKSWQCHRGQKPTTDGRNWKNSCPRRQLQGGASHHLPLIFPWCVHHAGTRQIWTHQTTWVIIQEVFSLTTFLLERRWFPAILPVFNYALDSS